MQSGTAFIQVFEQTGIKPKAPVQHKPVPAGWCFGFCPEQNFCGMCLATIKRNRRCGAIPPHGLASGRLKVRSAGLSCHSPHLRQRLLDDASLSSATIEEHFGISAVHRRITIESHLLVCAADDWIKKIAAGPLMR